MVEFDPLVWGILVGLVGILLWIVTNVHLKRTGTAIKADIDEKREATQEFVTTELKASEARIQTQIEDQLKTLKADLETVTIEPGGLVEQVRAELLPAVTEKVENIKSVLLGKLGYATKGVKAVGEGIAEMAGERIAQEAGFEAEWEMRLAQLGMDDEWMKRNKAAAFGLSLLKRAMKGGEDGAQIVSGVPRGAKQVRPGPKPPYGGI